MFGRRRRREEAAADAAREAERHALFARLAERPEHICPFLGLADERTEYVAGINEDHRCFAFGDPTPLSAEQQTRVCQERGYGHCPRYLRGVLVIPSEELQALRQRPTPEPEPDPQPEPIPPPAQLPPRTRRRRAPLAVAAALVLLLTTAAIAYLIAIPGGGIGVGLISEATPTARPTPTVSAAPSPTDTVQPSPSASASVEAPPTPEPTPAIGDTFAFYEVSVGPEGYVLYEIEDGDVIGQRTTTFRSFSFAQVLPEEADGEVYWVTQDGGLAGFAYLYPDSGPFRIRAVFLDESGARRSVFLETDELTRMPEATPAP